jgi:hypothetical protein
MAIPLPDGAIKVDNQAFLGLTGITPADEFHHGKNLFLPLIVRTCAIFPFNDLKIN